MIIFFIMADTVVAQRDTIDDLFQAHGVRLTAQRRIIWDFFTVHDRGCSIADAVAALQARKIGQATVYRTVSLLIDVGLLRRVQATGGAAAYIAVLPGHRHPLICQECRRVVEFDACDLSVLERLLGVQTGFTIRGHHLEVFGLCPACQHAATH